MLPRIDTHQHFWQLARGDYTWLSPQDAGLQPLQRDFGPADLCGLMASHGIAQTVLVQATDTEAETDYLLSLAEQHDWIAGVVGWIDLSDPSREPVLERWAAQPKFKGVRPMLQDLPNPGWIVNGPHPAMIEAMVRLGLRLDALVKPPHLRPLLEFVERWPDLPVVIDHAAKPVLRQGWRAPWVHAWNDGLTQLARHPRVDCKFSALLTEAEPASVDSTAAAIQTVRPVWERLLRLFGPARLMWGSDWPVLTLAADYRRWVAVSEALIGELAAPEQGPIWASTARRFYALPIPTEVIA